MPDINYNEFKRNLKKNAIKCLILGIIAGISTCLFQTSLLDLQGSDHILLSHPFNWIIPIAMGWLAFIGGLTIQTYQYVFNAERDT